MQYLIRKLANVIHRMPSTRYLAYMRSPAWTVMRKEHLLRCEGWCEICRQRAACQVHHWTYDRLGHELPQDLCAVCVDCHHKIHCSVMPANDNELQLPLPLKKA